MTMDIHRLTKDSPEWLAKAYDYIRTDAFCFGQNIPIEIEFGHDGSKEELRAVILVEDHKPVAGCRIRFPKAGVGKIERVCTIREKQKAGYGRAIMAEAEKWIAEHGAKRIVIVSQDRAAGFYEKLGYAKNPDISPSEYESHRPPKEEREDKPRPNLGFSVVMVEKHLP
jgi:predicted GNAT family N-acyltransferase